MSHDTCQRELDPRLLEGHQRGPKRRPDGFGRRFAAAFSVPALRLAFRGKGPDDEGGQPLDGDVRPQRIDPLQEVFMVIDVQ